MRINAHVRLTAARLDQAERIATLLATPDMGLDDTIEFKALLNKSLVPGVEAAKAKLEQAAQTTALKIRAWALIHIREAKQLGRSPALFEKLLNDPLSAARQLALHLMGVKESVQPKNSPEDDALLDSLLLGR